MNNTETLIIVIAAACAIFWSIWRLTRGVFNAAVDLRDNKNATIKNTEALKELSVSMDGRMTAIESWIREHDRPKPLCGTGTKYGAAHSLSA